MVVAYSAPTPSSSGSPARCSERIGLRKPAACIVATNASLPDSQPLFANCAAARHVSSHDFCIGGFFDLDQADHFEIQITARFSSRANSLARLAAGQIALPMEFLAGTAGKFGLDRFKRRLQALVDGHEFETLNLFSGQDEGREMKGIQCSQ